MAKLIEYVNRHGRVEHQHEFPEKGPRMRRTLSTPTRKSKPLKEKRAAAKAATKASPKRAKQVKNKRFDRKKHDKSRVCGREPLAAIRGWAGAILAKMKKQRLRTRWTLPIVGNMYEFLVADEKGWQKGIAQSVRVTRRTKKDKARRTNYSAAAIEPFTCIFKRLGAGHAGVKICVTASMIRTGSPR